MNQYEDELRLALGNSETVKWKGLPAPYKLTDADNKKSTMTFFALSIIVAIVLSILYSVYAIQDATTEIHPFVYVLTIGFPFMFFVDPIRDAIMGAKDKDDKQVGLVFYRVSEADCGDICSALKEKSVVIEKK